jgi:hypothetical protein
LIPLLVPALLVSSLAVTAIPAAAGPGDTFAVHLTGDEEVPPRETPAQGQAIFKLSADGTELSYRLIVANIENVVFSHIHLEEAGVNGPIVAFLFHDVPPGGGPVNGVLATGTITAADLINSLAGHPLSDLIDEMRSGNAYVNVHTNDGVAPINTGPGDFPMGEIRGQI